MSAPLLNREFAARHTHVVLCFAPWPIVLIGQLLFTAVRPAAADSPAWSDPPGLIDTIHQRSDADEDRLLAGALAATARLLAERGADVEALAHYQRAWHWNPQSGQLLMTIVSLAQQLGRHDVALRYAVVLAQRDPSDETLLRQLAAYLTADGELNSAQHLYALWLHTHGDLPPSQPSAPPPRLAVLTEVGRLASLQGDRVKASQAFAEVQAAVLEPSSNASAWRAALLGAEEDTWKLITRCHLAAGKAQLARAALTAMKDTGVGSGELGYWLARIEALEGQPQQALRTLRAHLTREPAENQAPYRFLEQLLAELGQSELLGTLLDEWVVSQPDQVPLQLYAARHYATHDELERSIALYLRLTSSSSPRIEAIRGLVEIYARQSRLDDLRRVLEQAAVTFDSFEPLTDTLVLVANNEQVLEALLEHWSSGNSESRPARPSDHNRRSRLTRALLAACGRFQEATVAHYQLVGNRPQQAGEWTLQWAMRLLVNEQYALAAEVLQTAMARDQLPSNDGTLQYYLAGALEMAGETDAATAAARRAIELHPTSAEMADRLAWIQFHAGRADEAIAEYRRLLRDFGADRNPVTRDTLREARFILANLLLEQQELAAAAEVLQQILDEFPTDVGAMNDLGYLWANAGTHLARAQRMIETANAAEPNNPAYRDSLGWLYYRQGEYADAIVELERAVALSQPARASSRAVDAAPDGVIVDHLGDAYLSAGRRSDAIAAWTQAAELLSSRQPQLVAKIRRKINQAATKKQMLPNFPSDSDAPSPADEN